MKRFKLDKLLFYRKKKEELISRDVSNIRSEIRRMEDEVKGLERKGDEVASKLKEFEGSSEDVWSFLSSYYYLELTRRRIEDLKEKIALAEERLEEKRKELVEASKSRKVVEKLKSKWVEEFLREASKKEQKLIDEVSINAFAGKGS